MGRIVNLLGSDDVTKEANFISLMFFILAIGCLAVYFVMGWTTNIVAQVSGLHFILLGSPGQSFVNPFAKPRRSTP